MNNLETVFLSFESEARTNDFRYTYPLLQGLQKCPNLSDLIVSFKGGYGEKKLYSFMKRFSKRFTKIIRWDFTYVYSRTTRNYWTEGCSGPALAILVLTVMICNCIHATQLFLLLLAGCWYLFSQKSAEIFYQSKCYSFDWQHFLQQLIMGNKKAQLFPYCLCFLSNFLLH